MGVHLLLFWPATDGAGRREAHDALADAIACLGTAGAARWTATATALRRGEAARGADDLPSARAPAGGDAITVHRVALSDEPGQLFLLSRASKQVVQAGSDMQALLDRAGAFKARGGVQLEGARHAVGDFTICLARAVQAPQHNFVGLAVDVGYAPLDDPQIAAPLLQDMAAVLQEAAAAAGGALRVVPHAAAAAFQLPAIAGPRHRAAQYVSLLSQLLEQQQAVQQTQQQPGAPAQQQQRPQSGGGAAKKK